MLSVKIRFYNLYRNTIVELMNKEQYLILNSEQRFSYEVKRNRVTGGDGLTNKFNIEDVKVNNTYM